MTEYKHGEVVSKFIIPALFLRMTNFEKLKYLDGNMALSPVFYKCSVNILID